MRRQGKGFGWLRKKRHKEASSVNHCCQPDITAQLQLRPYTYLTNPVNKMAAHRDGGEAEKLVSTPTQRGTKEGRGVGRRRATGQNEWHCTSGKVGLNLHVLPILVLRVEVKHGQNGRDRDEDRRGGIVHPETGAPPESEHGRLERRLGPQIPLWLEPLWVLVLLLVHVHRPDVRKDDGTLWDVVACDGTL